jgi:cell envelope opacity-associated protein A
MQQRQEVQNISDMKIEDAPVLTEEEKIDLKSESDEAMEKPDEDEGLYSVTNFTV